MPLTILLGPSSPGECESIAAALATYARVEYVSKPDAFRRAALARRYDFIVLCAEDGEGIPNERLLRFCLARVPEQRVVSVLPASARLADVDFDASANLSYYPLPAHALPADFNHLAEFVNKLAGRRTGTGYPEA